MVVNLFHPRRPSVLRNETRRLCAALLILVLLAGRTAWADDSLIQAGVAEIDITPTHLIRLSGYGARSQETDSLAEPLRAKALAFGTNENTALLLTVDNTGVPSSVVEAVFTRIAVQTQIARRNFAVCSTHTHTGPMLTGVLPNLFASDIPAEQQAHIDEYTATLVDRLEQVALAALAQRQPAKLFRAQGSAAFAQNRRTPGGPVDHSLSLLCVKSPEGTVRALFVNYACHCTTLGPEFNQFHADWAGDAQAILEDNYLGAIALIAVGCGADSDPQPRTGLVFSYQHGSEIATEVSRLLDEALQPLNAPPVGSLQQFDLPYQALPTREEWESRATQGGIVGYHAQKNLARLDRGETLPSALPYYAQTWVFGDELAMVFLSGEVVVDYALRLKSELDPARLWINAYANDVPCYIPSKRILQEGGYEAESSLWYYDRPTRLAPEIEDLIINSVHVLLPPTFSTNSIPYTVVTPLHAISAANLHGTIGVRFNQPVEKFSAETLSHYSLSNGTVVGATLQPDGKTVALDTSGFLQTDFTLQVNGVTNLAGSVASDSISGTTQDFISQDIGGPADPGSALACGFGDFNIVAGGNDIWFDADSFHFLHQERMGDFDVRVQVAAFQGGGINAKAALSVRESLQPGSRHFTITVYPSQANWTAFGRLSTDGTSTVAQGGWRVNWLAGFPNVWMRLKRVGNKFAVFGGSNGTDWTPVADLFIPEPSYPETVFVGLATTSTGDQFGDLPLAAVEYRNFGEIGLGRAPVLTATGVGKNIKLSWPAPASDFTLQLSADFSNPNGWSNVLKRPSIFDGKNSVTLPVASGSWFYRLQQ